MICPPLLLSTVDPATPFQPFETFDQTGVPVTHSPPPVPEPRFYGVLLLTVCVALVVWARFRRARVSHLHP